MINKTLPAIIFLFVSLLFTTGCNKDKEEDVQGPFQSITVKDVSETGFLISWQRADQAIEEIRIEVSTDKAFAALADAFTITDAQVTSHQVDGLGGPTRYYFRLIAELADGTVVSSNT